MEPAKELILTCDDVLILLMARLFLNFYILKHITECIVITRKLRYLWRSKFWGPSMWIL
jgi:hypothetical protein